MGYLVHEFTTGGIERCVVNLVNNMDRGLFKPTIFCLHRSGEMAQVVRKDVDIVVVGKKPGLDFSSVGNLAKLLDQHGIDVLHSHNWGTLIEGSLARRRAKVPAHVHTEHGQGLHLNLGWLKKRLRRTANAWAFNRLDALAICARSVGPLVEARSGYSSDRMVYMPNGVPDPVLPSGDEANESLRDQLAISNDAVVLGSTGRLVPVKGFDLAIKGVAQLKDWATEVHLVLVGDGEVRQELEALADELGVSDRVHLVGFQSQVGPWLELFDVFLNTSVSEAMSLSVLEAMASGTPTIASDVGDNKEILLNHQQCGMILQERNADALATATKSILTKDSLLAEFRHNARVCYESHYSINSMVRRHQELYQSVIDRN